MTLAAPTLAALVLLALSTAIGIIPVRHLIRAQEARHELKQGSAGWLRNIRRWVVTALWLMAVWFLATIIGDWAATGDLDGAIERSFLRLQVLLEIAAALGDN